jgi:RNA polymerase sigma-70 factor (ECF subfamily)
MGTSNASTNRKLLSDSLPNEGSNTMNLSDAAGISKAAVPQLSHSSSKNLGSRPRSTSRALMSDEINDDMLVARARAGDEVALRRLLDRHKSKLLRLAMRFVGNENDAQEILQDVLVIIWRKLPGFEGRAQVGSWLYRVTMNASLMFLRSRNRILETTRSGMYQTELATSAEDGASESSSDSSTRPDEQLQSAELKYQIQKALDKLPSGLRLVFCEREVKGNSTQQTAESLGLSKPAVKTRLHRARAALRENMSDYLAS